MKINYIPEPDLEFGAGRHIDIRFGLMNYGPFDYANALAPKQIKLGIVGTNETIEGICRWLERARTGFPAKKSNQPNLFPAFSGYGAGTNLQADLLFSNQLQRTIPINEIEQLNSIKDMNERIGIAVQLFLNQIEYLAENSSADIVICAVPNMLLELTQTPSDEDTIAEDQSTYDFRDLLKARAMKWQQHTQIVLPTTYGGPRPNLPKDTSEMFRSIQDEATRAWNLYVGLYYKAKGIPWRLIRHSSQLTACYVGVSFYRSLDKSRLQTSIAQVFNELGDGVIVRGGAAKISKEDRQPHLSEVNAQKLLYDALEVYRTVHLTLPARLVLHKTSAYSDEEMRGFRSAMKEHRVSVADFLHVRQSHTRLLRDAAYPPLRGMLLSLDDIVHILYTRGSVDFFQTYPGMYIPHPLELHCEKTEQTPLFLAEEILGLSKMNWNKTQFDGTDPITIWGARQVGRVLKYIGEDEHMQTRYSFYM